MQLAELTPLFAKSQRAVQVYDKDLNPALDDNGEARVVFQYVPSNEPTLASLRISVVGWSGMIDENGQTIPFSKDKIEMLTEEWLDVTTDEDVESHDAAGHKRTERKPITRQFAMYINRTMNEKEFWTRDPFGNASSTS